MSITQARSLIVKHHKYAWVLTIAAVLVIGGISFKKEVTHAMTYYFTQASWTGGASALTATHSSDQSNWNKYSEASSTLTIGANVSLSTASLWVKDDVTMSTSTPDNAASGGGFGNGSHPNTSVSSGSVGLTMITTATKSISTGYGSWGTLPYTCAVKTDGTLYCWGGNNFGQLGDGSTTQRATPVQVSSLTGVAQVSAGAGTTCAVTTAGAAYCWGLNANGQVGDGTTTSPRATPVQVSGLSSGVAQVSVGEAHACALKTDGTVYCWGRNNKGQLGDNTVTQRTTPVQVVGVGASGYLSGVASISAGGQHYSSFGYSSYTCATKTDGTAYCWGANSHSQIGNTAVTTSTSTPVQIMGVGGSGYLTGVAQIDTGTTHTCAVKTDGTGYCWGANSSGQLGDNTTTARTTPVQVSGLTGASQIAADSDHSCVVKSDGTAYCWGLNVAGEVGDNTTTQRNTPTQVSGLTTAMRIDGGTNFSCAVNTDGTSYCWGLNANNQLGDNSTTDRYTPTQILGVGGSGNLILNVYPSDGTFTSAVINFGGPVALTTLGYTTTLNGQTITIDARSGDTATPDGSWTSWQTDIANGGSISGLTGKQYFQYRANFHTSDVTIIPTLDDITVNNSKHAPYGDLISSKYNGESDANIIGGINWTEDATLPTGTTATFYLRTSASSDFSASSWSTGITSATSGCTKVSTTVTCSADAVPSAMKDGTGDQWFQYKVALTSDGPGTPTLDNIQVVYVVNAPPAFDTSFGTNGISVSQNSTDGSADFGKVNISYRVGDIDTSSFTPSFKYSTNGGSSWADISSGDLTTGATSLQTYTASATTTFSVVWNATSTLSASPVNVANAKIRVTVNDGDAANNIGTADSANFTLDTAAPAVSTGNFIVDSSVDGTGAWGTSGDNKAGIKLSASDYSTLQYRLCNNNTFPSTDTQGNSCAWSSLASSPLSLSTSTKQWLTTGAPSTETVYMQVRDLYGNTTAQTGVAPAMPGSFDYKDVSNTAINVWREFLSWAVFTPTTSSAFTGSGAGRYKVYYAVTADGAAAPAASAYSPLTSIANPATNYATHDITSATSSMYYYKVLTINDEGNISDFSAVFSDVPNGAGGAVDLPPEITNTPSADVIKNTSAHITFTTDMLATSVVEYGTSLSYGSTATESSYLTTHSVYLNSLTPNTTYYFRVKATNASAQDSTWASGTSFTTSSGPIITGVTPMNITDKTATIFWNTNASSTSKVYYGTGRSGSTLTGSVTVSGVDADAAGTNGLYQHQVGIPASGAFTAGNTYYYKVESTSKDGQSLTTTDDNNGQFYSFSTTLDTTAPTISGVEAAVISSASAVIVWTTDEPATSRVEYSGISGNYSKRTATDVTFAGVPSYSVYHVATLSSGTLNTGDGGGTNILTAETPYYYQAVSVDAAGNETRSSAQTFTTTATGETVVVVRKVTAEEAGGTAPDTTAPVISNITIGNITPFGAVVSFDTNEGAVGKLAYGKDSSYGDNAADDFSWATSHSIKLRGLTIGTEYHIKITAVDKAGNVGYSSDQTFKTSFLSENVKELTKIENIEQFQKEIEETIESILPSLVPPFVSKPQIEDVTENSAKVSFKTNIRAFPLVGFVEDNTYDIAKENPYTSEVSDTTEKMTSHELTLLNLKPNTKYHIQARAFSLPQVVGKSDDFTFTTQASKIQGSIVETKRDSFTVVWITDEPTSSIVEYKDLASGITQRKADDTKTSSHSMKMENLPSATSYEVNISGITLGGNLVEGGSPLRVTTSKDVTPPVISNFKVSNAMVPGRTDRIQTIISWVTDEPADSTVYYEEGIGTPGETKELINKSEALGTYVTDHNIIISSLKPGAIYRVKVTSTDDSGNLGVFGPRTIITPKQTESITDIIFKNFEDSFKFLRDM